MGWLSKIVLNGLEMLIKDSDARGSIQSVSDKLNQLWDDVHRYIWTGIPGTEPVIYYVAPNGDDSNLGTDPTKPLATISQAYANGTWPAAVRKNCFTIVVEGGV